MMTIILENLDKRRSYLCLETGRSAISRQIQKLTKQFVEEELRDKVPSHVFMLVYEKPDWVIYESHMKPIKEFGIPSGVRCYKASLPFVADVLRRTVCFPLRINKRLAKKYLGEPYGVRDIFELAKVCLISHNNGEQPDREGLICSEYAALCYPKITKDLNLPAHCITPGHWLQYLSSK